MISEHVCDVTDLQGNHCPAIPVYVIVINENITIHLCDRCFANVIAGAYGKYEENEIQPQHPV